MFPAKIASKQIVAIITSALLIANLSLAHGAQKRNGILYRVRKGDTLWDIARTYQISLKSIQRANPSKSSKKLWVGDQIFLPKVSTPKKTTGTTKGDSILYRVRKGDTLWDIARTYQISLKSIQRANPGKSSKKLRVGDRIFLPNVSTPKKTTGTTHKVRKGESIWRIAKRYGVPFKKVIVANQLSSGSVLYVGQQIFVPSAKPPKRRTSSRIRKAKTKAVGFIHPMKHRAAVTSAYGKRWHPTHRRKIFHHGIDLRAATGTSIYASKGGTVTRAGWDGGYGWLIEIRHANGYTTRYGHLSKVFVKSRQKIKQGQRLGRSGNTGISTGPHLHFEIRRNGRTIDPKRYVRF